VAALCLAAGLSTRQFYEEFRGLEDVLATLYQQINEEAERAALTALAEVADGSLERRAGAAFRAYAGAVTGDPRRVRIAFVEIVGASTGLEAARLARRARWGELIRAQAAAAACRGEAAARDYRITATAFIGAVNGLLHDWSAGQVDATLEEVVEELVRMLVAALRTDDCRQHGQERPPGAQPGAGARAGSPG